MPQKRDPKPSKAAPKKGLYPVQSPDGWPRLPEGPTELQQNMMMSDYAHSMAASDADQANKDLKPQEFGTSPIPTPPETGGFSVDLLSYLMRMMGK
jgi:hypothetical protein